MGENLCGRLMKGLDSGSGLPVGRRVPHPGSMRHSSLVSPLPGWGEKATDASSWRLTAALTLQRPLPPWAMRSLGCSRDQGASSSGTQMRRSCGLWRLSVTVVAPLFSPPPSPPLRPAPFLAALASLSHLCRVPWFRSRGAQWTNVGERQQRRWQGLGGRRSWACQG